jgi:hypothetical protein
MKKEGRQSVSTHPVFVESAPQTVVLSQINYPSEAKEAVAELLALAPDFKSRGRSLIRRYACLDENAEMLVEGLRKAGLEVS